MNPKFSSRMNTREQIIEACKNVVGFSLSKVIVHYNPSGGYNREGAREHIDFLMSTNISGIQWNGFATDLDLHTLPCFPENFDQLLANRNDFFSILQIGQKDYDAPEDFVVKLYNNAFVGKYTHLLLDGSGGRGIPFDQEKAHRFILTAKVYGHLAGIAVSGGLGPQKLTSFRGIKNKLLGFVDLSLDVEGNIRDENGFSLELAKAFLSEVLELYR